MFRALLSAAVLTVLAPAAAGAQPIPSVVVTALPIVQQNPAVLERDGTYSTAIDGFSYWAFNDTALNHANASGQNFFSNSLSWSTSLSAPDGVGLNADQLDSSLLPKQFIPFTAQEAQFNSDHAGSGQSCKVKPCGEGLAIWPGPIVYVPAQNGVIIPFVEIERGGPISGFPAVGGGIAVGVVRGNGFAMARPNQGSGIDPALLWPKGTQIFTDQAFLYDGYYYAYGSKNVFVTTEDFLGRVPVDQVLKLSAWRYYTGDGMWGPDVSKAVTLFEGSASGSSVFFDQYLNEWVAVYSENFANDIYYAVADAPEGPWSAQTLLAVGAAGYDNDADYAARAHPEFSPDGGRTILVTYVHTTAAFGQDLPTVKVVFTRAP